MPNDRAGSDFDRSMNRMPARVAENVQNVSRHYDSLFDLLDRSKTFDAAEFQKRPPIVNMGYWLPDARTAREAQEQFVRELAQRVPDLRGKRVLDVGCGLGGPAAMLACDYGAEVDGVNIVERQVEWARGYMQANGISDKVRIHRASAMDLPFPDRQFDVLFCLEAAHCFVDKPRFLREARRVLRDGGQLVLADIVGTNHLPVVNWQPALKLNLVTASDWARMIEAQGFTVLEKTMVGNAVYPGVRWWAAQVAPEKRRVIFEKSCRPDAPAFMKHLMRMRASLLEFLYCRSVLLILSRLNLREFVLFSAMKG